MGKGVNEHAPREAFTDYIPIHHVMYVEYGNKALLLLL